MVMVLLVPMIALAGERASQCNNTQTLRSWLDTDFTVTGQEAAASRMGDGVARGILYAFTDEELSNPRVVRRALHFLILSFSFPSEIEDPDDRKPRVTLLLLESIRIRTKDHTLRKEIDLARKKIMGKKGTA